MRESKDIRLSDRLLKILFAASGHDDSTMTDLSYGGYVRRPDKGRSHRDGVLAA